MSKTTNPYEFLVRWDSITGEIKGCHVKMITTHIDDETGEIIAVKESDAMPVAWAKDTGFPLDQVLHAIQVDALATAQTAQADKAAMEKDIAVARNTLSTEKIAMDKAMETERGALKADKDALVEDMDNERVTLNASITALSTENELLKTTVEERDAEIIKLNDVPPDVPANIPTDAPQIVPPEKTTDKPKATVSP